MYNLVGFQTNLVWGEQKRVFSMFPALENAEFLRYGVMHRNTYLSSPGVLDNNYSVIGKPYIYFAGQITGVEGYVESIASGLTAAISLDRRLKGKPDVDFTDFTVMGALAAHCSSPSEDFQPMNANYGILSPVPRMKDKAEKKRFLSQRALDKINEIKELLNE